MTCQPVTFGFWLRICLKFGMSKNRYFHSAFQAFKKSIVLLLLSGSAVQAQSLCWEITGNGLESPSWLYGTIHVGDKRAFNFKPGVMDRFNEASAFAMELNPDSVKPEAMLKFVMAEEGKTLKDYFTPEDYEKLAIYLKGKMFLDINLFKSYKPIFLYAMILQTKFSNEMGQALDLYLFKTAGEQGKNRFGLESAEEQFGAFESMGDEGSAKLLMESLDKEKASDKETEKMMKYYVKGDLEKLLAMMDGSEVGAEMEEKLLVNRNYIMADRMEPIIQKESTFVAVGAAHLPGPEGIIALLRKKGYTVNPL
jgi:uncharacterized protein